MGPRLLLTPLPWPAVATGRMLGLPVVFVILLFLDEAMKMPLKGVFPAQCEPCTPSAEQPARLCPLNFFYRLSNSAAWQADFCQVAGTSPARYESLHPLGQPGWKLGLFITRRLQAARREERWRSRSQELSDNYLVTAGATDL